MGLVPTACFSAFVYTCRRWALNKRGEGAVIKVAQGQAWLPPADVGFESAELQSLWRVSQAGLLLAETEFAIQVESDIAPYKGLLMGLFFMTVGMEISCGLFLSKLRLILGGILLLLVGKVRPLCRTAPVLQAKSGNVNLVGLRQMHGKASLPTL